MNREERVEILDLKRCHLSGASPLSSQPLLALPHHHPRAREPLQPQQGSSGSWSRVGMGTCAGLLANSSHGHRPISSLIPQAYFSWQIPK